MIRPIAFLCALLLATPLAAEEDAAARSRRVVDALQQEVTTCTAFYKIMQKCLDEKDPLYGRYDKLIDQLYEIMIDAGKRIGMSPDAITARYQAQLDQQTDVTQNSCPNVAALAERHGQRCKQVTENPQAIAEEYLRKSP